MPICQIQVLSNSHSAKNTVISQNFHTRKLGESYGIFHSVKSVHSQNLNRIVIAHLNIIYLKNKFDKLVISEAKLDNSFSDGQFRISDFAAPFRKDRNSFGGGIMIFMREDIPPASSCPRADHPQFPSVISIFSFHPEFLCDITSSFKSTKKSKSKPTLHRSLSNVQKTISSFSLFCIQQRIPSLRSLFLIITVT